MNYILVTNKDIYSQKCKQLVNAVYILHITVINFVCVQLYNAVRGHFVIHLSRTAF